MRITGGTLRGRNLKAPEGLSTRPTTDRVREALFNILAHHDWGELGDPLDGAIVLDAFAGTGALGLEALSRGAARAFFFEKDRKALSVLRENITSLKLEKQTTILPLDVTKPPKTKEAASLLFLDPPYKKGLIPRAIVGLAAQGWVADRAMLITETAKNEKPEMPETCALLLEKTYSDTTICFWKMTL